MITFTSTVCFSLAIISVIIASPLQKRDFSYAPSGPEVNNWSNLGCANDLYPNARALNAGYYENQSSQTIATCLSYCASQGTYLAGIEYGYQCFCGPSLDNGAAITQAAPLSSANNGGCTTACPGNTAQNCGGTSASRLSLHLLLILLQRLLFVLFRSQSTFTFSKQESWSSHYSNAGQSDLSRVCNRKHRSICVAMSLTMLHDSLSVATLIIPILVFYHSRLKVMIRPTRHPNVQVRVMVVDMIFPVQNSVSAAPPRKDHATDNFLFRQPMLLWLISISQSWHKAIRD